jgi:hypothetical protein
MVPCLLSLFPSAEHLPKGANLGAIFRPRKCVGFLPQSVRKRAPFEALLWQTPLGRYVNHAAGDVANLMPIFEGGLDPFAPITLQCRMDIPEDTELFINYESVLQNAWSTVPWLW